MCVISALRPAGRQEEHGAVFGILKVGDKNSLFYFMGEYGKIYASSEGGSMKYFMGIDMGTQGARVGVFDEEGTQVADATKG